MSKTSVSLLGILLPSRCLETTTF